LIFGKPEPSETLDFCYRRRHLETTRDRAVGGGREFKYIVELDDLQQVIAKTLDRIHKRDGVKIFKETASYLLKDVAVSIEVRAGRKG
jgi:hypothetical protein